MGFGIPKYDLNGLVKEIKTKSVSLIEQNGNVEERVESEEFCRYDKSKNLIESVNLIPNKFSTKTINTFDEKNQLIESSYFQDDSLQNGWEFEYDLEGKLIEACAN